MTRRKPTLENRGNEAPAEPEPAPHAGIRRSGAAANDSEAPSSRGTFGKAASGAKDAEAPSSRGTFGKGACGAKEVGPPSSRPAQGRDASALKDAEIAALREMVGELRARVVALEGAEKAKAEDRLSLVVFSGSLDRQLAALVMATGAAASGMQVDVFFTFWGLSALRDPRKNPRKRDLFARLIGRLMPRGFAGMSLSTMNLGGVGPTLIRRLLREKRFASLDDLVGLCADLGVRFWACDMSRELLGISLDELVAYPHLDHCGVANFVGQASHSKVSLFI